MQRDHATHHKYEESHTERLAIVKQPSRTLKVITMRYVTLSLTISDL